MKFRHNYYSVAKVEWDRKKRGWVYEVEFDDESDGGEDLTQLFDNVAGFDDGDAETAPAVLAGTIAEATLDGIGVDEWWDDDEGWLMG